MSWEPQCARCGRGPLSASKSPRRIAWEDQRRLACGCLLGDEQAAQDFADGAFGQARAEVVDARDLERGQAFAAERIQLLGGNVDAGALDDVRLDCLAPI